MERFWGLSRNPFAGDGAAPPVRTALFDEALARLDYLCRRRRRLGAVLGTSGSGKTTALRALQRELLERSGRCALVSCAGADADEALFRFADALEALRPGLKTPRDVRRALFACVERMALAERRFTLLVDDLQAGDAGVEKVLLSVVKTGENAGAPLTVAFASSYEAAAGWSTDLRDAVDLTIRLAPWTFDDVRQVIDGALEAAGRERPVFDDQALLRICELTAGVPRAVVRLAELALVSGAADERVYVSADVIDDVAGEALSAAPPAWSDGYSAMDRT